MKILVCIKQVPDMESRFKIDAAGTWYAEADLAWRMNEYDEYAVEQAVQLKEQLGDAELVVLSVGPNRVKEALKKALAMGCDRAVQVVDEASSGKDPFQIATAIATWAKPEGFDLVFTGMQSQDRGSAQVGVLTAELLGIRSVTTIVDFALEGGEATVKRELEGGQKAVVRTELPALFTCQLGLNTPRYPTLPNIMKAKKKELSEIPVGELLQAGGRLTTRKLAPPEKKGEALILEGEVGSLVDQVLTILKEKTTVV